MAVVTDRSGWGPGVDFPASQVIFDALAMGRDWLWVQEFNQMEAGQTAEISTISAAW